MNSGVAAVIQNAGILKMYKKYLTSIWISGRILIALDKCENIEYCYAYSAWRSTQVAEEAPLLRV